MKFAIVGAHLALPNTRLDAFVGATQDLNGVLSNWQIGAEIAVNEKTLFISHEAVGQRRLRTAVAQS